MSTARLGLGLAALGRPGYINLGHGEDLPATDPDIMLAHAHRVLDAAWDAGVRHFDAARSYGRAEEFLGRWLREREIEPGAVTVASKWGYTYTAGWRVDAEVHEVKDHSANTLRRQIRESRDRLGAHLGLYQIHSATRESGVLVNEAVLDELARLRDEGLRIGLSVSGPAQSETIREALTIRRGGEPLFAAVQATWNVLERSTEGALAEAHAAGAAVIVKEGLANGLLTRRGTGDHMRPLMALAAELETTPDALALAVILARPWADVVLSGAATPDQLLSNVSATSLRLPSGVEDSLRDLAIPPDAYWAARSSLAWN